MAITLNGTTGITSTGGYTGDGIVLADGTPSNTLVTTTGGLVGIGTGSPGARIAVESSANLIGSFNGTAANGGYMVWQTSGTTIADIGTAQNCFSAGGNDTFAINGRGARSLLFGTNNTERMRIDSSGNLLVGTASQLPASTSRAVFTQGTADYTVRIDNSSVEPYGVSFTYSAASPNSTGSAFIYCSDSGSSQRFSVRANGGVYNYSGNNVNLSDRREKTDFAPSKNYLDVICAIPVQTFNYIDQNNEEDPGLTLGVVAQDVQAVAPEFVMESNWGTKEEPKMRLSIYQTDLQYALMKCIQEQQALITQLQADVAALKGTA